MLLRSSIFLVAFCTACIAQSQKILTVDGFIVTNELDTIDVVMLEYKRQKIERTQACREVVTFADDGQKVYKPTDILGYGKGKFYYKAMRPVGALAFNPFFLKQITFGAVTLYYSELHGSYFFKKKGDAFYYMIGDAPTSVDAATGNRASSVQDPYTGDQSAIMNPSFPQVRSDEQAFAQFFCAYFKDNSSIVNKLRAQFYNFYTIESMFREYNAH